MFDAKKLYHRVVPFKILMKLIKPVYKKRVNRFLNEIDLDDMPLPQHVEIETINRCNGKCAFCPVNATEQQRPLAKMPDELFEKIINDLSSLGFDGELNLFSNNEPFLDARMIKFAEYAKEMLPNAFINISTNGSVLKVEDVKEIIKYIDALWINNYSMDGKLTASIKAIADYIGGDSAAREKITIVMRKQQEVLTNRGGQSPNKKSGGYRAA